MKKNHALVTGATKGLGRGTAQAIADAGGNVIAIGRNQSELNSLGKIPEERIGLLEEVCDREGSDPYSFEFVLDHITDLLIDLESKI